MNYQKVGLLIGAGFTKNFGGYLGSEMWAKILNYPGIQNYREIMEELKTGSDLDFEGVYYRVMNDNSITSKGKKFMHEAILHSYDQMHEVIFNMETAVTGFNYMNLFNALKDLFSPQGADSKALWFSLNQDLLFERWFRGWRIISPAAEKFPLTAYPRGERPDGTAEHLEFPFKRDHFVKTPEIVSLGNVESAISDGEGFAAYIKMHGSYGWLSSQGDDLMVLGQGKKQIIKSEPLLMAYFQLFKKFILSGSKKLLIIGYGFRDDHINTILLSGIRTKKLKLFILTPTDPRKFKQSLYSNGLSDIWNAIEGYFQSDFKTMFRKENSVQWRELKSKILS